MQAIQHAPMQAEQCRLQVRRGVPCDIRKYSQMLKSASDASTLLHEELGVVPQPQADCSGSTMVRALGESSWPSACLHCLLSCWPSSLGKTPRGCLRHGWKSQSVLLQLD